MSNTKVEFKDKDGNVTMTIDASERIRSQGCKYPTCHSREYQERLAAAVVRDLSGDSLAAAAPDLLEALRKIKAHFDTDEYAYEIARAAIAKATGATD